MPRTQAPTTFQGCSAHSCRRSVGVLDHGTVTELLDETDLTTADMEILCPLVLKGTVTELQAPFGGATKRNSKQKLDALSNVRQGQKGPKRGFHSRFQPDRRIRRCVIRNKRSYTVGNRERIGLVRPIHRLALSCYGAEMEIVCVKVSKFRRCCSLNISPASSRHTQHTNKVTIDLGLH